VDRFDSPEVEVGWEVRDRRGKSLGKVISIRPGYVVVERGLLFRTVLYVPNEALIADQYGRVRVGVTASEALDLGWQWEPGTIPFGTEPLPREPLSVPPETASAPGNVERPR